MSDLRYRALKKTFPKTFADGTACLLLCVAIPTVYWFEIFVVMPCIFSTGLHTFHVLLGTFVLGNILGNFALIMAVDTSTRGLIMPSTVPPGWHVCAPCEAVAPPRTRHCGTCGVCVLKKEHHCLFTGCCIGHTNHRFFFCFLVYMWGSTLYCSIMNSFFIAPYLGDANFLWTFVRIVLPGLWLIANPSVETLYGFLFSLNVIGCLFLSVLLYFYARQVLTNTTTRERNDDSARVYDHGTKHNVEVVLGMRWYLTWLLPTISSPLPYDGMDWRNVLLKDQTRLKTK